MLGHFDGHEFTPTTSTMRFNFGPDFYAAQTYSNVPGGRRIMSAWMWGWGDDDPSGISTTGGMMTLPAELSLVTTPDGPRVKSYPVSELNVLRGTPFTGKNIALSADTEIQNTSSGNQCDIEADIDMGSAQNAGICVLKDSFGASTIVGYDAKKSAVYVDRGNSGLKNVNNAGSYYSAPLSLNNNRLHLSIYVDHATVEVFANNGIVPITVRCFPPADATNITAFANGGNASLPQIKVYPMSSIWKR
jgi:sucrose-6-phosphate hydrolase SacC (GH32 family)